MCLWRSFPSSCCVVWSTGVLGLTYPLAISVHCCVIVLWEVCPILQVWVVASGICSWGWSHRCVLMCVLTVVGDEAGCWVDVGVTLQISGWVARSVFH